MVAKGGKQGTERERKREEQGKDRVREMEGKIMTKKNVYIKSTTKKRETNFVLQGDGRNRGREIKSKKRKEMTKASQRACRGTNRKGKKMLMLKMASSQNSPLPLLRCSGLALPAVRLGGRETRPLVAPSD